MILIDTNCLYLLSGHDKNNKICEEKLLSFLSNKDICITSVSIFEILNNPSKRNDYSKIINAAISKCRLTHFANYPLFGLYFDQSVLYDLELKDESEQEKAKNEISKAIVGVFSVYYSNLLSCAIAAYFIPFLNFDDEESKGDDYLGKSFQENFDILENRIRKYFSSRFQGMVDGFCFNEKSRKSLIEETFFWLAEKHSKIYNKTYLYLDKKGVISYEKLSLSLLSLTKRINPPRTLPKRKGVEFESFSLFRSLTEQLKNEDDKKRLKEYLAKIAASLSKVYDDQKKYISPFLNSLFTSNLNSLLFEKARFSDNDLLDSLIIDFIYFARDAIKFEGLLSFDKKMIRKAKKVYSDLVVFDEDYFK